MQVLQLSTNCIHLIHTLIVQIYLENVSTYQRKNGIYIYLNNLLSDKSNHIVYNNIVGFSQY